MEPSTPAAAEGNSTRLLKNQRRRVLGNDHPDTLASIHSLGSLLQSMGKHPEAALLEAQETDATE